jgi:hypothetical protein
MHVCIYTSCATMAAAARSLSVVIGNNDESLSPAEGERRGTCASLYYMKIFWLKYIHNGAGPQHEPVLYTGEIAIYLCSSTICIFIELIWPARLTIQAAAHR